MCILLIAYQAISGAPVLVAANREERYDRPADPPRVHVGDPSVLCGTDRRAGGTWLGVNTHGVLVAVTNRPRPAPPPGAMSRGRLCRALLACVSAASAADSAVERLSRGSFAGVNVVCLDGTAGTVVHGDAMPAAVALAPGWHAIANGDLDDPHDARLRLALDLLAAAPVTTVDASLRRTAEICAHPDVVVDRGDRGTVSSEQVVLASRRADAVYRFAAGRPDEHPYEDGSAMLRSLLGSA